MCRGKLEYEKSEYQEWKFSKLKTSLGHTEKKKKTESLEAEYSGRTDSTSCAGWADEV